MKASLVIGGGPGALAFALLLNQFGCDVDLWVRPTERGREISQLLDQSGGQLSASGPVFHKDGCQFPRSGRLRQWFSASLDALSSYQVIVLAIPSNEYVDVALQMRESGLLQNSPWILLPSTSLGSAVLVAQAAQTRQVVSCSNFFAAAKCPEHRLQVEVKAIKRKLYLGMLASCSDTAETLVRLFASTGLNVEILGTALEAEARNITTYVHPSLFVNPLGLSAILGSGKSKQYMYRFFPEGPITKECFATMLDLHQEISSIVCSFNGKAWNLLKFLNDDNYPVPEQALSRREIDEFESFDRSHQMLLLYVRYATLLVDPYSTPDPQTGRFVEFSAVPFPMLTQDPENARADLPRIPLEDICTLETARWLGSSLSIETPTINRLVNHFCTAVRDYEQLHRMRVLDWTAQTLQAKQTAELLLQDAP
jgi:staphylopine/pseudopaline/yersinopine synthase